MNKPQKERTSLRTDPGKWFLELFIIVAIVAGLAFLVQAFVVKPFRIPSESMYPTLKIGQRVLVNRIGTHFSSPGIGNIVVFHPPVGGARKNSEGIQLPSICGDGTIRGLDPNIKEVCGIPTPKKSSEYYVKRVVAGPGDRIRLVNGQLFRNGKRVEEKYARPCSTPANADPTRCNFPREVTIPKGMYFMMGDNRGDSDDSRFWGPVPEDWVVGKAFFTYWPINRIGGL